MLLSFLGIYNTYEELKHDFEKDLINSGKGFIIPMRN